MSVQNTSVQNTSNLISEKNKNNQDDFPVLGYTVFWKLGACQIPRERFALALESMGLAHLMPSPAKPRRILTRALESWITQRGQLHKSDEQTASPDHVLLRVIPAVGEYLYFNLVDEIIDLAQVAQDNNENTTQSTGAGLDYRPTVRIRLHKTTGDMDVRLIASRTGTQEMPSAAQSDALAAFFHQVRCLYDHHKNTVTGEDLSGVLVNRCRELQAIALRDRGGLYFINAPHRESVYNLQALAEQLNPSGFFAALTCVDSVQVRKNMQTAAFFALNDELSNLKADLERFSKTAISHREKTITEKLKAYADMRAKVSTFVDLLGYQADLILQQTTSLETTARKLLAVDVSQENSNGQMRKENHS